MKRYSCAWGLLALGLVSTSAAPGGAQDVDLTVKITDVKDTAGVLRIGLVSDKTDFPDAVHPAYAGRATPQKDGSTYVFRNVKPGRYAVALYQDLNNNGQLDRNLFGLPKEPYGFSNTPGRIMVAPKFEAAAFDLDRDLAVTVDLKQ